MYTDVYLKKINIFKNTEQKLKQKLSFFNK